MSSFAGEPRAARAPEAHLPNPAPDIVACETDPVPCLALRPRQAAQALGIGERLLWSKTNAGEIPCVRIGRAVVYPIEALRVYLAGKVKGGAA